MTECNEQFNIFETFLDLFVICINIKSKENIQTNNLKQCYIHLQQIKQLYKYVYIYIYIYIIIIYMWKKQALV